VRRRRPQAEAAAVQPPQPHQPQVRPEVLCPQRQVGAEAGQPQSEAEARVHQQAVDSAAARQREAVVSAVVAVAAREH
jgi:hypothetical protein